MQRLYVEAAALAAGCRTKLGSVEVCSITCVSRGGFRCNVGPHSHKASVQEEGVFKSLPKYKNLGEERT